MNKSTGRAAYDYETRVLQMEANIYRVVNDRVDEIKAQGEATQAILTEILARVNNNTDAIKTATDERADAVTAPAESAVYDKIAGIVEKLNATEYRCDTEKASVLGRVVDEIKIADILKYCMNQYQALKVAGKYISDEDNPETGTVIRGTTMYKNIELVQNIYTIMKFRFGGKWCEEILKDVGQDATMKDAHNYFKNHDIKKLTTFKLMQILTGDKYPTVKELIEFNQMPANYTRHIYKWKSTVHDVVVDPESDGFEW